MPDHQRLDAQMSAERILGRSSIFYRQCYRQYKLEKPNFRLFNDLVTTRMRYVVSGKQDM